MANYDKVLESVIEGNPCAEAFASCPEHKRIESSKNALLDLQGFHDVTVAKVDYENEGLNAKLARENGAAYIKLKYVHRDRAKTKWKIMASVDIGTVMRPLVTEEIFFGCAVGGFHGQGSVSSAVQGRESTLTRWGLHVGFLK